MRLTEDLYLVGSGGKGLSRGLDCEVYVLDAGSELVLVDSGCGVETERIVANMEFDGLDPRRIGHVLLTHEHSDHACGAAFFRNGFGANVVCHSAAREMVATGTDHDLGLDRARPLGVFPPDFTYTHCPIDHAVEDDEMLQVGNLSIRAIYTPGHSPGCVCYLVDTHRGRALFSGDVLFWGGYLVLLNYWGCNLNVYRENIRKLAGLDVNLLLPGHQQFTLRHGQKHIDRAIEYGEGLYPPPSPPRFH